MTLSPDDPTLMISGEGGGEASGPSIVDQKIVEAAIRRGLISAVQGTNVLESLSVSLPPGQWLSESNSTGALPALVSRGLVSKEVASELEDEVKNDFVPGYGLMGELGRGGMGVVYKALHKKLDRVVALKVVNPSSSGDPDYLRRFKQEALALAKLNHPNIVQVYDYGETANKVYLALEFVEGKDALRALREGGGRMREAQALRLVRDSALGLGHAHAVGIIHRDVKPANLMLVARAKPGPDDQWVAKVTDLGLARQAAKEQQASMSTKAGTILGSPAYMAPEQADGEAADYRSDIYALGATLYHLITGKPPYDADSAIKVIVKKQTERLDDPRALVPGLSDGLVRVLDRCLARPREERYATYEALVEDVERLLRGEDPSTAQVPEASSSLRLGPLRPPTRRLPPKEATPGGSGKTAALVVAGAVILSGAGSIALAVFKLDAGGTTTTATDAGAPASAAARATATLEALAGLSPADVVEPVRLREVVAQVQAVPEAERTNVSLRLASVVGKALDAVADERAAALEATLARAEYAALVAGVARALEPYLVLSREPPARLRTLQEIAAKAGGDEGLAERAAWKAAQEAQTPVAVLAALTGFAERFPWSPAFEQAQVRWAEANVKAPEVKLEWTPAEASITLDGAALPAGPWAGRLSLGEHTVSAEAPDHFVLERRLDVKGPTTVTLRLNPKPVRPLVEDPDRGSPAWFPRRALPGQWVMSGEWRSIVERSALQGEGKSDGSWATASRDLGALLTQLRIGEGPWRLVWECTPPLEGAAELRLAGEEGAARMVVVGATRDEVYVGLRSGDDSLEVLARMVLPTDGTAFLSADWDGRVLLVQHKRELLGSVAPAWKVGPPCIQAAVRGKGPADFRGLELRALTPSGAR